MPDSGLVVKGTAEEQERAVLKSQLDKKYGWYQTGTKWWSIAYNGSIYSSAALSAVAAVVPQLMDNGKSAKTVSTICAGMAALLTTYIAGGGFGRKWKANRLARGKITQLYIDLEDPNVALSAIRTQLKHTVQAEDDGIVGPD
jgi:hypothetical protein